MDNQEIFKEYEQIRKKNRDNLKMRIERIYKRVPRVKEIDEEVSKLSIKTAKFILQEENWDNQLNELVRQTDALIEEKTKLLNQNDISQKELNIDYDCDMCKDTGYESKSGKKCVCFTKKQIVRYYSMSNMFYTEEDFSGFDINFYSDEVPDGRIYSPRDNMKRVLQKCLAFTEEFGDSFRNMFFCGETGLGKTFLCKCIGKEILDRGKTVLYISAYNLMKYIESIQFNKEDDMYEGFDLSFIYEVDLLIIDDLGTEFSTSLTQAAIFNIVNQRIEDRRMTIISSNLTPNEMAELYTDRLVSRIMGVYDFVEFYGKDIRIKKKYAQ